MHVKMSQACLLHVLMCAYMSEVACSTCLAHLVHEAGHLNGCQCCLTPLVPDFTPGTVKSLQGVQPAVFCLLKARLSCT